MYIVWVAVSREQRPLVITTKNHVLIPHFPTTMLFYVAYDLWNTTDLVWGFLYVRNMCWRESYFCPTAAEILVNKTGAHAELKTVKLSGIIVCSPHHKPGRPLYSPRCLAVHRFCQCICTRKKVLWPSLGGRMIFISFLFFFGMCLFAMLILYRLGVNALWVSKLSTYHHHHAPVFIWYPILAPLQLLAPGEGNIQTSLCREKKNDWTEKGLWRSVLCSSVPLMPAPQAYQTHCGIAEAYKLWQAAFSKVTTP